MAERLTIARLGRRGDGIAQTPDGPLFVPFALPGETVEAETAPGQPDRRHLRAVVSASADRIAPVCPHFGACGGCAMQHLAVAPYRAWKRSLVTDALSQAGIEAPVDDLIDAHGEGRRRAVFHARRDADGAIATGFAAPRAHHIVAIDRCPIFAPALDGALAAARAIAATLADVRKPLDIQATATDSGLDVDVRGSGTLTAPRIAALARIARAHGLARLTRHGETVAQRTPPRLRIGRATVVLPPGAFLQATALGEETLARLVGEQVGAAKAIADLFAGVGPFALRLAQRARIIAADSDERAIGALKRATETTQGLKPIDAQVRDLFRRPFAREELSAFDAVVFDPPRQGAQAQARALAASAVPLVVAVSCNPASFARDVRILIDGGYRLTCVTPVDQFRYSPHVEIVARLEK
ncbi:MAG: class I SAM-dependent RNA methyltransferase [Xanthobacteraceae bacterium]